MKFEARLVSLVFVPLFVGCFPARDGLDDDLVYQGPGSEAWGDEDVACNSDGDCLTGEACLDSVCQIEKCNTGLSDSISPLGMGLTFLNNSDIGLADGQSYEGRYWIDGYSARSGTPYDYSWDASDAAVIDIGGGNFYGTRPENYVVVTDGQRSVTVIRASGPTTQNVGFEPVAVSSGDVDGDGLDEVLALGPSNSFAVCHMDERSCDEWEFDGSYDMIDIAGGDLDGDGRDEPVLLFDYDGYRYLYGLNIDSDDFGQEITEWVGGWDEDDGPRAISVGDVTGDFVDEVVVLWDGEWGGWVNARIVSLSGVSGEDGGEFSEGFSHDLESDYAIDLTVGDSDMDDQSEVYVLTQEGEIETIGISSTGTASTKYVSEPGVTGSPMRIALADHDGDSPRASLVGDSEECIGNTIPIILMTFPPYDRDRSGGWASVAYGDSESVSESLSDTVSLGMSVDVGYKAEFGEIFGASLSTKVSMGISRTLGTGFRTDVGSRYSLRSNPELYGSNYGAVVVSWGCFDGYTYELDDPENYLNADGEEFVMTLPTGGGVTLLSSHRYNAMASELGLPVVDFPYTVGDIASYPTEPETLDGGALNSSNLLFTDSTTYTVSDVGWVSWRMSTGQNTTNSVSMYQDIGVNAGVTVGGVKVGVGTSYGWGQGYSVSVGESAFFSGSIPSMPDNLNTPEDEYQRYAYQTTPYIYMQDYEDADGNEAGYYVMTYTAAQ